MQISEPTISRDIEHLKEEANETIKNHIQMKLPYEYTKCIQGLEEIIKESWIIATRAEQNNDTENKLQSLALIKDVYSEKMNLLTNAFLLQDSIKFVTETKQNLSNKKENKEYSDIQGSAETNNNSTEQYNQVF